MKQWAPWIVAISMASGLVLIALIERADIEKYNAFVRFCQEEADPETALQVGCAAVAGEVQ
jgi:hypothetical protein